MTETGPVTRAMNAETELREEKQRTAILRNRLESCEEDCDSLEAETYRLRKDLRDIARWCESEAIEAAGDAGTAQAADDFPESNFQSGRRATYNRVENKLNALLGDES